MNRRTKVYVAGSSGELSRARHAMSFLREAGFEIAHDWTDSTESNGANGGSGKPENATLGECLKWAMDDICAIEESDAVLFLGTGEYPARGMHAELGFAFAKDKPIIWAGPQMSIFSHLATRHCESDADALRYIVRLYFGNRKAASDLRY